MDVTLETEQRLIEEQLQLETDMLTGGIHRFRKIVEVAIERGKESHTPHGRAIISRLVHAVAGSVVQFINNPYSCYMYRHIIHKYYIIKDQVCFLFLIYSYNYKKK